MNKDKALLLVGSASYKALGVLCVLALGATSAVVAATASADPVSDDSSSEELETDPSGLPSKTAPFDQTVAYFLWPYQWGTQNVGTKAAPAQSSLQVDRSSTADVSETDNAAGNAADAPQTYSQGNLDAGEYGWKGPGTRPTEPNLKSLDAQIKLVKESGMPYVKTSYLISPLNAANADSCDQSVVGSCQPSTELPDEIIQHILDAGLKPIVYFSQGNPDPKAVSNPDPNQVYKTVPSFTKQQVKDTISHAIQKFANKGIIWESWNEPESEEHWPGGNNRDEAKTQWIEVDQFIGDTIQQYDPKAPYVWGNFSGAGKLSQYTNEIKAAHATALSGHGYWINSPESPLASSPVGGYDFMDSEFGCSAGNTETGWSCGFSGVPKDSNLQGIWLIRQLLVKDIKGLNLASPYRMVGYDSFSINEDNDPANPGAVKTTDAYNIIKNVTLALKGYSYVDGTYQNADDVYRAVYKNKAGEQKLVYWTADKPTLDNDGQTKQVTINFDGQNVQLTAKAVPQVYTAPKPGTYLQNLTAWKTTDGQVIQAHGGSVLKDGNTFYWVGQGAPDNVPTDYNGAGGVFKNQWLYTTINMYKSTDLVNWQFDNAVTSIDDANAAEYCDGNVDGLTSKVLNYNDQRQQYKDLVKKHPQYLQNSKLGCKIERPHILKNAKTGKYLIWAHWEGTVGYGSSQLIAFQSDTVDGKYQPLKWQDGQVHAQPKVNVDGKLTPMASRDLSAWADPDTGNAYIISSTEKVRLYKLNDTYTGVDPNGSYQFPNVSYREAPSLFKENGRFYMITSGQDYWDPTQTEYASTANIEDPNSWTKLTELQSRNDARKNWGNQDPNTRTYIGQPTYVLQYQDANNKPAVVLLADDWNPLKSGTADVDTTKANYVMTPVNRLAGFTLSTPFQSSVVPTEAGQLPVTFESVEQPTDVTTEVGTAPKLPATVRFHWSDGSTTDEAINWDAIKADQYQKVGDFTVTGKTLDRSVSINVVVKPVDKPTFTGADDTEVEQGSTFDSKAGVAASDPSDGDLTAKIKIDGTVDTSKPGKYTLKYSVTDSANNTTTITRTVTVYATFVVSFDAQGGSAVGAQKIRDGRKASKPADPTREGYTFAGWAADKAGKEPFDFDETVHADATVYAQWKANSYTVRFHVNDGSSSDKTEDQKFLYGQRADLRANDFTRKDWQFAGWNTKADGTGDSFADKQSVENLTSTADGVYDLYAKWTPTVTGIRVTGGPSKTTYHLGEAFDPAGLVVTADWSDGSHQDLPSSGYTLSKPDMGTTGDKTITVTYLANNGRTAKFVITVTPADRNSLQTSLTAADALQESDYTAQSWKAFASAKDNAKTVLADASATDQQIQDAASQLGDAQSKLVRAYTVWFDSHGGSSTAEQKVADGQKVVKPKDPTRSGYEFVRWTTDAEGANAYDFDSLVHGDFGLHAQWKNIMTVAAPTTVTTPARTAPSLPKTVTATWSDGKTSEEPVTWDSVDRTQYAQVGGFDVHGSVEGWPQGVTVHVRVSLGTGTYTIGTALPGVPRVLDIPAASTKPRTNVQLYVGNGTAAQKYRVTALKNGNYTIVNQNSRLPLAYSLRNGNGSRIQQREASDTYGTEWRIDAQDDGSFTIRPAADGLEDMSLDVPAANNADGSLLQIWQFTQDGSNMSQRWRFIDSTGMRETLDRLADDHRGDLKNGTYTLVSSLKGGKVLDVAAGSTADAANVQLYSSNGTDAQVWKVTHDGDGYVTLTNAKSGKVLDVAGGSAVDGSNAQQYASNGTYAQKWVAVKDGDSFKLVSALNTQRVLDISGASTANGANVQIWTSNNSNAQRWSFRATKTSRDRLNDLAAAHEGDLVDGVYTFGSSQRKSAVLDVAAGSKDAGANVQLYASNGTDAQKWKVSHDKNGYVTLTNVGSGKVLDIAAGSSAVGANAQQYVSNGTWAQKWIAVKDGDSIKLLSAVAEDRALDIAGGSTSNGANVQVYSDNGTPAQRWVPVKR